MKHGSVIFIYIYIYIYIYIHSGKRQDFGGVQVHIIGSRLESRGGVWGGEWGSLRETRHRAQRSPCRPWQHILAVLDFLLVPRLSHLVAMLSKNDAKMAQHSPRWHQDEQTMAPRGSEQTLQPAKILPKRCTVVCFLSLLFFS